MTAHAISRIASSLLSWACLAAIGLPTCANEADSAPTRQAMVARIDELIAQRLQAAGYDAAPQTTDAEFLRRISLDLTGAIPRVSAVREFLADEQMDKRTRLIDALLDSPGHATHLANTWRSFMLPGGLNLEQINNVAGVQNWLRQRFAENLRYDNLVAELLVSSDGGEIGPALYYTSLDLSPEKLAASTARLFLGLQIECAQCHDHPFDHWKQRDFWGYAAFFARLRRPEMAGGPQRGVMSLVDLDSGEVKLPNTEEVVAPKFPAKVALTVGDLGTRRQQLAIWMASRDNPYLARAGVNRVWWQLFGRGLVEPVDDLSPRNEPSHPQLLNELAEYFASTGFDIKELYRTLTSTQTYQRTSIWQNSPAPPAELYAHRSVKTLSAEQLYDSINRVLHRSAPGNAAMASPLFDPARQAFIAKVHSSGRNLLDYQAGILQALALLNGRDLAEATDPERSPLIGSLAAPFFSDDDRLESLFLTAYARFPSSDERQACRAQLAKFDQSAAGQGYSDILWALLNSAEFALNH